MRAAASHTAALAGSMKTWEALVTQAGAIPVKNFDEMADLAVSFYFLPPIRGPRVGVVGGGGGPSVLAADECEEAGLDVIALPTEVREELKRQGSPVWDWVGNPADGSIGAGSNMLQLMARNDSFDLLIAMMTEDAPAGKEGMTLMFRDQVKNYIRVKEESSKPLLGVVGEKSPGIKNHNHWRWRALSEARTNLLAADIPVYPTAGRAARAARKLIDYYQERR